MNDNASISSINISDQGYPIKSIIITCRYNKDLDPAVTIAVSVGGESFASNQTVGDNFNSTKTFNGNASGAISISFTNETGSGTGHGTFYVTNVRLVEGATAPATPYTVRFYKTDGTYTDLTEAAAEAGVTPPVMSTPCDGWAFQGWSKSQSTSPTSTTVLTKETLTAGKYYPSANTTLYPVYTKAGTASTDLTIVPGSFSSKGSNNYGSGAERTASVDGISFGAHYITGNATNSPADGKTAGTYLQCKASDANIYNKSAFPGSITKVVINQYAAQAFSLYCGSSQLMASDNTSTGQTPSGTAQSAQTAATQMTWNVSAASNYTYFDLKKGSTASYVSSIVVTYLAPVTYYYSYPDCSSASQVVTPTFSLSAGTYIGTQSVSISCATDDATIYYTTNGNDPTTSSSVYSSAVSISSTATLKAMAVADGLEDSEIASATYTIRPSKTYNLVTDASSLGIGDKIVILENGGTYAMSTTQNDNNRGASTDFVLSGSTVRVPDAGTVQPITLEAYADGYWYFNVGGDNYLAATGSSSALLKTQGKSTVTTNTTGKWSIALASSTFTVKTNDGPSYNTMRYNSSSTIFNCYSSATQTAVKVYVYSNTSPTIQTNPTSLSGFSATYGGSASDAQNVYVSGRNLTGNITVTPPTGYEIKKSSDGSYSSSAITLSPSNGKVSVTLNVRLAAGNNAGDYNGNLTLVGYNSEASTNVALTGNVAKITPVITFTLDETAAMANTAVGYTLSSTSNATPLTFSYVRGGSSVSTMITNDTENKKISISEAGTYKIRVNQAADANHNAAAQVEQELTITVRDVFKDMVNGYSDINGDDTGSGITTPTFAEMEDGAQNACHSTTRYLLGWIKASDLTTIYSGETGYLEDAAKYEDNKAKIVAPGAETTASGVTWYAVWAEEEE